MIAKKTYRHRAPWLPRDDKFLLDNYSTMTVQALAAALERNEHSIRSRLGRLGHRFNSGLQGFGRSLQLPLHMQADSGAGYLPTPEEIAAGCASIQAKWSERERISRIACERTRAAIMSAPMPHEHTEMKSERRLTNIAAY